MVKVYAVFNIDHYEHGRSYALSIWDDVNAANAECARLNSDVNEEYEWHIVSEFTLNVSNGRAFPITEKG